MSEEKDESYWKREFERMTIETSAFCGSKDPDLRKKWTRKLNKLFAENHPGDEKLEVSYDRPN